MDDIKGVFEDMLRCCEKACEIEERHYDSLLGFSSRLLSCISILSVTLVAALAINRDGEVFSVEPISLLQLAGAFLAASFLFALLAQWRFRIVLAAPPLLDIERTFIKKQITTRGDSADYYITSLSSYHGSLAKRNRILRTLLDISLLLLIVAVVLAVAWTVLHCV